MKYIPVILTAAVAIAVSGCATKGYVSRSISPVSGKVDQQGQAIDQTNQSLQKTQADLANDETKLSATSERAQSADTRAGEALAKAADAAGKATDAGSRADQANQRAQQVGEDLGALKGQVASLDDYKKVSGTTVNFKFNSDKLDADARKQLDEMALGGKNYKRYFVAVEGFTDKVGDAEYNTALSKRRADAVVAYLVSQHDIPIYRIQMVGLGKDKPVDEGRDKAARAKNRRVEVNIYSADNSGGTSSPSASAAGAGGTF